MYDPRSRLLLRKRPGKRGGLQGEILGHSVPRPPSLTLGVSWRPLQTSVKTAVVSPDSTMTPDHLPSSPQRVSSGTLSLTGLGVLGLSRVRLLGRQEWFTYSHSQPVGDTRPGGTSCVSSSAPVSRVSPFRRTGWITFLPSPPWTWVQGD